MLRFLLVCLFLVVIEGKCLPKPCPSDWPLKFDGKCYKFLTTKSESNWFQAFRSCILEQDGRSNLIRIESQDEMDFIKDTIKGDPDLASNNRFWTAMNDISKDDVTRFAPEDVNVKYIQWGRNEANDLRNSERCVNLLELRDYDMNDSNCHTPGVPLCELPAIEQPEVWK